MQISESGIFVKGRHLLKLNFKNMLFYDSFRCKVFLRCWGSQSMLVQMGSNTNFRVQEFYTKKTPPKIESKNILINALFWLDAVLGP